MSEKKSLLSSFTIKPKADAGGSSSTSNNPVNNVGTKKNTQQRWILVVGGVAVFGIATSALLSDKSSAPAPTNQAAQVDPAKSFVDVTPQGVDQKSWQQQSMIEMTELRSQNARLENELKSIRNEIESGRRLPAGVVAPPNDPAKNLNSFGSGQAVEIPPPPIPTIPSDGKAQLPPVPAGLPPIESSASRKPFVFKPPKPATKPEGDQLAAMDTIKGRVEYKPNPYQGNMPAGAFAPVVLLNGLDAGTSSSTQSNPMPVLMNIQDHAILPGSAKYKVRNCFVLASAFGDLSAERVYARLSTLSCMDKNERLILSTPVQGYLVDSDGKIGLRGEVIDRQGAKLAKALLAGFAQGLSSALGSAQSTLSTSAVGQVSSISGGNALQASGLQGGATAAQQLAQFYLKEASSIFPVIAVDTGRTGTIVFTQGVNLTWGETDSKFVKEVTPQN